MADSKKKDDLGQAEVEKKLTEEQEQGYRGVKADPTPNHHYTVDGVTSGKPTPETDEKAAEKAASSNR